MKNKSKFEFTTKKPVAIIMIALGIAVFGFVSLKRLSWDLMPEISYPTFTIRTEYAGAAPEEVENIVSRPLEEQLGLIKDLISLTSISRPEQSDIILEFTWDVNLDRAAQEIREKIDQTYLDRAVERPMILRFDPSLDPIVRIGIVSDMPLIDLRELVEDEIARELESIPGVAAARVKGGFEKEILVKLDEKKLAVTRIGFDEITRRLTQENINLAGGNIKEGETEYIVRTLNEFRSVKEIGNIIVVRKEGVPIRLKDVADVTYSHKERKVITRVDKKESIEINIYKEADANIVAVSKMVKDKLFGTEEQRQFVENLKKAKPGEKKSFRQKLMEKEKTNFLTYRLPENINYHILSDQSIFIENSINEVRNTAIIGGILAIIILFLFLQHFSTTLIVAVSIPLSIIATFAPLSLFQVSLNIMSLGGLALGIGMLVDNSIVVMESIFRCREEGDGWVDSAVRGVSEVGGAVIASTLTTIAVFFPIVFVEGIAGQIFGDLSLAVVFSLLASLMVSLFFIPMLASRKFGEKKKLPVKTFKFKFEKEKTTGSWFMILPETVIQAGTIIFEFVLSVLNLIVSLAFILLYIPISIFDGIFKTNLKNIPEKYSIFFEDRFADKKILWDNYFKNIPFLTFLESMKERSPWFSGSFKNFSASFSAKNNIFIKIPKAFLKLFKLIFWDLTFSFVYYVIRFLINGFLFIFARFLFSIVAILIILFKGLTIMVMTFVIPVIKIVNAGFGKFLNFINNFYPKLLSLSLKNDTKIIASILVVFVFTILVILPGIGKELIPEVHQGTIYVNLTFPVGTPVEKSDTVLQNISEDISQLELTKGISYYAGTTKDELSEKEVGEHIGKITVNIKKSGNIQTTEEIAIENIRSILKNYSDIDYNISRPALFTIKSPIELVIKGFNLEQLRKVSSELYENISDIEGLKDVESSVKSGFPELVVEFDRTKLSHYGMNAFDVASLIKNKIEGFVATKYKERDKRVDIRVYLKDEQRQRAENIKNLIINPGMEIPIPLSSIAKIKMLNGPNEIRRVNQDRSAVISANITDISLTEAAKRIFDQVEGYPMPPDFTYELSGQNEEMKTSSNSLTLAMVLAIFLVYIVMASQFESFLHPFLILFTIPMALIGVFLTLFVLKIPIGVTVYIGMITLVGIVVNNAIVFIDYINILRSRGIEKIEAIKQAGKVRLRPILITTLTTVLGLLPMAIGLGEGTEIRTPMAISIIAGLLSATFLTLILIPLVYNKFSK
ncbi:MAG: efflux RND transporter permease subunit [Acidobacteriota bacterium]